MGNSTENLNLYLTDMDTDGNDTFDFQRDLNDNNNKIDSAIGKLSNLTTEQQANLVSAINEIVSNLDGKTSKSLSDLNAVGQAILDKKVEVEALLAQNGYAKFSWKENNKISNLIINWGGKTLTVGDNVINLPIAYPSDRRGIAITPFYPNNATGYPQTYGAFFKTGVAPLSTINIYASVSMYVAWFVIGY